MVADLLAALNAVLGLLLAVFALRYARHSAAAAVWIKYLTAVVGLYWGGLYIWVLFTPVGLVDPVWFGQVFVRPAFTFTMAVMAAGSVYRWRSHD
jgi:hypothetical protein